MKIIKLSLLSIAFTIQFVFAQTYHLQHYAKDEGLPQLQVISIHQDAHKIMWFGTGGGLAMYDSRKFHTYSIFDGLNNAVVFSIANGRKNEIWVGTGSGMSRIDISRLGHPVVDTLTVLPDYRIFDLRFDPGTNYMWVLTYEGDLFLYRDGTKKKIFTFPSGSGFINSDGNGNIWVGQENILCKFSSEGELLFKTANLVEGGLIGIIALGESDYRLVGSQQIYELDLTSGKLTVDRSLSKLTGGQRINSVVFDNVAGLWLGTNSGLYGIVDGKKYAIRREHGLETDNVIDLLVDQEKNLWICTNGSGIYKLMSTSTFSFVDSSPVTNAVIQRADGVVLSATFDGIRAFRDYKKIEENWFKELEDRVVWAIKEDHNGNLWVGLRDGVNQYRRVGREYVKTASYLDNLSIYDIEVMEDGAVLLGASGKVFRWSAGKISEVVVPDSIQLGNVRDIIATKNNGIWFGHSRGALNIRGDKFIGYNSKDNFKSGRVITVYETGSGKLWCGTDRGLFELYGDRFIPSPVNDLLAGHTVTDICEPQPDLFYIGTEMGIDIFNGSTILDHIGKDDGLIDNELGSSGSFLIDTNNKLWIGLFGGLTVMDLSVDLLKPASPDIYITQVSAIKNELNSIPYRVQENDEVPFNLNNLNFEFVGISFVGEHNTLYRWYLEGFEGGWTPWSKETKVRYTHLDPGDYVFHVQTRSGRAIAPIKSAVFHLTIARPFWQTFWFLSLVVFVFLAAGYQILKWQTNKIRRQNRRLEILVEQRTQELVTARKYVENIIENAGDVLVTVDRGGKVLTWNKEAERVFGYTAGECIGNNISSLDHPDDTIILSSLLEMVDRIGEIRQLELAKSTKNGQRIELLLSITRLDSPFGGSDGYTLVMSDISERNRLQEKIVRQEKMMASVDALQKLLGTIAHHINNAVTAIYGLAQLSNLDTKYVEKLIDATIKQSLRIKAVIASLSKLVDEMNLKSTDYAGEKEKIFDIDAEIREFIAKIDKEENGDSPEQSLP
jgi:PAS domain S-box-containing protein